MSEPAKTPDSAVASALQTMLAGRYGEATQSLVLLLLPALKKLTIEELPAFLRLLNAKYHLAAMAALYEKMSNEELVAAKEKLAELLEIAADDHAEIRQQARDFLMVGLKVGLGIALAGVGL